MVLYIDTTLDDEVLIRLKDGIKIVAEKKFAARRTQAEKLLPAIANLLKTNRSSLKKISNIQVNNRGGSFTALRIGVVTANALAYALKVPIKGIGKALKKSRGVLVIEPKYDRKPVITKKKTVDN